MINGCLLFLNRFIIFLYYLRSNGSVEGFFFFPEDKDRTFFFFFFTFCSPNFSYLSYNEIELFSKKN